MEHMSPLPAAVEKFLNSYRERGISEKTVQMHHKNLNDYIAFCEENHISCVEQQTSLKLNTYIIQRLENTNNTELESIRRSLRVFNSWFKKTTKFEFFHPGPRLPFRRRKGTSKEGVSRTKVTQVIQTCGRDLLGVRDRVIIAVLEETGIRPLELCKLNLEDFSWKKAIISIKSSYPYACREMRLGKKSNLFLKKYLRLQGNHNAGCPLFSKADGTRLAIRNVYSILQKRSREANIHPTITPGILRYSFGLETYQHTHDLAGLKHLMGYKTMPKASDFSGFMVDDLMRAVEGKGPSWNK